MTLKQSRRRGEELEGAILDAAWAVLVEHGYFGFTYEAVAARAGTSRPVLYRRWPQRDDLLLATITRYWQAHPIEVPDTGSLRDDVLGFLHNAVAARTDLIAMVSVQLLDYFRASGTNFEDLRAALRVPGRANPFDEMIERAVRRGELADRPRSTRVKNLPFDLLRHDILMTMQPMPDHAIAEIVDEVWLPLITRP